MWSIAAILAAVVLALATALASAGAWDLAGTVGLLTASAAAAERQIGATTASAATMDRPRRRLDRLGVANTNPSNFSASANFIWFDMPTLPFQ
jgi:hypothetical protein